MAVFGRRPRRLLLAIAKPRYWAAVWRTFMVYRHPFDALRRYIFQSGSYPWSPDLRTPIGRVRPVLYGPQDVLTLNEIFCRRDYGAGGGTVVVDVGANIGLASLFFLTRNLRCIVYASEPVHRNQERLRDNLSQFSERVIFDDRAVSTKSGSASFVIEETGRLGGLEEFSSRRAQGTLITVECVAISELLDSIISSQNRIDLLKIDTEGNELELIRAIPQATLESIEATVWENNDGTTGWL